jgi:hypothetical protein
MTASGSTASATAYKYLTTIAGASFRDNVNVQTNALRYNASNGCGILCTGVAQDAVIIIEDNFRCSKLQIAATGSNSDALANVAASYGRIYEYMIFERTVIGTLSGGFLGDEIVRNCLIVQRGSGAVAITRTGNGSPSFYNCTFAAPDDLATAPTSVLHSEASGTVTIKNCGLFAGDSTKAIKAGSATFNFTTCYSDISGTAGVTQTTYSSEFQNVNNATRDFRLVTGAAQKDTGTTDATNGANDIVGTTRPSGSAYDVGCWEFITFIPDPATIRLVQSPLRW